MRAADRPDRRLVGHDGTLEIREHLRPVVRVHSHRVRAPTRRVAVLARATSVGVDPDALYRWIFFMTRSVKLEQHF